MEKIINITDNYGAKYNLGNNPSVKLEGVTERRVYIGGSGRLNLDVTNVSITDAQSLLIEGFDAVFIFSKGIRRGVLNGGIQGIRNRAYFIKDIIINGGGVGILINNGEWVEHIDLKNIVITNTTGEGVYIGKSRSDKHHIGKVTITDVHISNCKLDLFQIGATKFTYIKDCIFLDDTKKPWGHDKDIMINPNCVDVKVNNTEFKTLFVHKDSKINIV